MVPFTVYLIQRALKVWPRRDPGAFAGFSHWVRPGWVVMEIATAAVGVALVLFHVRFPFLLFPVSVSLWFLSMDLTPLLVPGWERMSADQAWKARSKISLLVGLLTMLLAFLTERQFGREPDLAFWLYLFGTIAFSAFSQVDYPTRDLHGSLLLLVNMGLILLGSHLRRTTLQVFGVLGVLQYFLMLASGFTKTSSSALLWLLKALMAAALFSQAVRHEGSVEVLAGLVCVLAFNFNYVQYLASGEVYSLLLLFTNLGFVSMTGLFDRPLNLWIFTLPSVQLPMTLIFSVMVLLYHAKLLKYFSSQPDNLKSYLYLFYRLLASLALSMVFVFLGKPHYAWVGGAGIPLLTSCCFLKRARDGKLAGHTLLFAGHLSGVMWSLFLESNLLYLACCLLLLHTSLAMLQEGSFQRLGCVLAVLLVLLSVPLNSKFLISIGALYVVLYLSHLAYTTFKNSLLFPLVLILLGVAILAAAVGYQHYEGAIQESWRGVAPDALGAVLSGSGGAWSFWEEGGVWDLSLYISSSRFDVEGLMSVPIKWLFWPGAVTHALVRGPAPFVAYVCTVCIMLLLGVAAWVEFLQSLESHLDDRVEVCVYCYGVQSACA